jgi:stearoyl-CoA desaturase (delta-9 desaturase)
MLMGMKFHWLNAFVITLTPPAAVIACFLYIRMSGFQGTDLLPFFLMYALTGTAITAGYHRYYAHRAFECRSAVKFLMLIFGAAALENSALSWVADHREHHRHTDREQDPYNIQKGFFWAHIGWIYFKHTEDRDFSNVKDLKKDALIQWQHKYYVPIALIVGLGVPFLIGLLFGRPWGGVIWGGLLRLVVVHHATFLINSAAHTFGTKPYSETTSARDSWWLPFFSFGEGYHNYHHAFPSDYRNGTAWYHWDTTKWVIRALALPGWTWNLRRSTAKTSVSS